MGVSNQLGQQSIEGADIAQLQLAEAYFSHSISGLVILDREYNFIRVNQAYADACRRPIEDFAGRNHFDLYPSDARLIFDDVVRHKRPFVTFTRAFEFPDQPERGITYWDWTLVPVLDADGEIKFLVFSLVDVTAAKRGEDALRVAALVYQHSSEAMMVVDADNRILSINDSFTRLTGYESAELIGKNPRHLSSGLPSPAFYQEMWQSLTSRGSWEGELTDRTKNGDTIVVRLTINSVYDEKGTLFRRVALFSDITEKRRTDQLIWEQANIDSLTGLPNRHLFLQQLHQRAVKSQENGGSIALLLIDLDHFKEINDTLGHRTGDLLLTEVARLIQACIPAAASLARLGGDEFAVLLDAPVDEDGANAVAQACVNALTGPITLGLEKLFISASVGITIFPQHGTEMDRLLRHADQAMYAAKRAGRNRICLFTTALENAAQTKMSLTNDLRNAAAAKQFVIHYQPIIELATGRMRKAEALLRWNHPVRGMVPPSEFIPLAEANGFILEIGQWVFEQAVAQLCRMRAMGHEQFQISVNVSPMQFQNDAQLAVNWLRELDASALPPSSLVVEITEGLLLDLSPEVKHKLLAFGEAGLEVALDDFGTGYSSLAYLKKFNIDYIKIDRVFVRNLAFDADDRTLCEAMIAMAHKLGLKVVAEGVETEAQRDFLLAAGCDFAQGFLYYRPLAVNDFDMLMER